MTFNDHLAGAIMASSARASHALLFMRQCRQPSHHRLLLRSTSTDASQYSPSSFNKPLRSPLGTPPPSTDPNIDHLPPLAPRETLPASERPLELPQWATPPWAKPRARSVRGALIEEPPKPGFFARLRSLFRRTPPTPTGPPAPFHISKNPYRARKKWPPDFSKLHPKQQFYFEKVFRRRALLKWARPNWHKWIKRLQRSMMITVGIYFILIGDLGEGTPFDGFRMWFFGKLKHMGLTEENRQAVYQLEMDAKNEILKKKRAAMMKGEADPTSEI